MRGFGVSRWALWGLIVAPAAALAQEAKASRTQVSANGVYSVRLTQAPDGSCTLEVAKESETLWALNRCVGTADDLYFVSNSGERVWVLKTLPEKPGRPKAGKPGTPWFQVVVAVLYGRDGKAVQTRRLSEVVAYKNREDVRQLGKHFKWLEGVLDVPGKRPRVNDQGQVELETVGAKTVKLNF